MNHNNPGLKSLKMKQIMKYIQYCNWFCNWQSNTQKRRFFIIQINLAFGFCNNWFRRMIKFLTDICSPQFQNILVFMTYSLSFLYHSDFIWIFKFSRKVLYYGKGPKAKITLKTSLNYCYNQDTKMTKGPFLKSLVC